MSVLPVCPRWLCDRRARGPAVNAYLVGNETLILALVRVPQVERVAGERHTTGLLPLDEGRAGLAYTPSSVPRSPAFPPIGAGSHSRVISQIKSEERVAISSVFAEDMSSSRDSRACEVRSCCGSSKIAKTAGCGMAVLRKGRM
jgi:hypothetical protein